MKLSELILELSAEFSQRGDLEVKALDGASGDHLAITGVLFDDEEDENVLFVETD